MWWPIRRPTRTSDPRARWRSSRELPGFNRWKYGLQHLPAYAKGQTPRNWNRPTSSDIVYLLGQQDTDPNHPALDKSCAAEAQGAYRLIRGHYYFEI
jgi:hypothetical protein